MEIHDDSVNYVDAVLSLKYKSYKPYKKPNAKSNHPPSIIKNISGMIYKRRSSILSTEHQFKETKHDYKVALEGLQCHFVVSCPVASSGGY